MQPKNREEKKEIILHTTISYNHFQNILRLFEVLPNFTSPQVKRCLFTYKHGKIRVASRFSERVT